jgi:hypothetical protein
MVEITLQDNVTAVDLFSLDMEDFKFELR